MSNKILESNRKCGNYEINDFKKLNKSKRLGYSGVLPEKPRVGSTTLSLGNMIEKNIVRKTGILLIFWICYSNITEK